MAAKGRISTADAAKLAMVTEATIRTWCIEEKLDGIMYAHKWWVTTASVKKMLATITPRRS
jgi:hypothetical protein